MSEGDPRAGGSRSVIQQPTGQQPWTAIQSAPQQYSTPALSGMPKTVRCGEKLQLLYCYVFSLAVLFWIPRIPDFRVDADPELLVFGFGSRS
jgi:hypothetical protein